MCGATWRDRCGVYVWDYAGKMEIMRQFWDVEVALDPAASKFDAGQREPPLCNPGALKEHFVGAGLTGVEARSIDAAAHFVDFDDYWVRFAGSRVPHLLTLMSLGDESRRLLKERLRAALPIATDGSIDLIARAWAVRGQRAGA